MKILKVFLEGEQLYGSLIKVYEFLLHNRKATGVLFQFPDLLQLAVDLGAFSF